MWISSDQPQGGERVIGPSVGTGGLKEMAVMVLYLSFDSFFRSSDSCSLDIEIPIRMLL